MNLWASIGAFVDSPLKFLNDPAGVTLEYQTRKAVTAGMTKEQILKVFNEEGLGKDQFQKIYSAVLSAGEIIVKNLPLILMLAVGLILLFYLMPILRLKK